MNDNIRLFGYEISRAWIVEGAIAILIAAASLSLMIWVRQIISSKHAKMVATPKVEILETPFGILSRTRVLFFVVVAIYLGAKSLTLSNDIHRILNSLITIALFWQAGLWITTGVSIWLGRKSAVHEGANLAAISSLGIIKFIAQATIWTLVLLLTLDNLGVRVTALVAGLGVGGVAIALAVQNVLGDILASLAIAFDRPFVVGDFLIIDNILGGVEYIGIKTTHLRSLDGEQIIMSNADIIKSRIHNYGRQSERRVLFTLHIAFETPVEVVESLASIIKEIVKAQPGTRFDRSHFSKYTDSALEYEVVYFVLSADYSRYMDIQQTINIELMRKFAELGVEFAHPATTVYFARNPKDRSDKDKQQHNELPVSGGHEQHA